jgi:hypothetical protein
MTLAGPAGVTGALSQADIRCDVPTTTGPQISVLARPVDPNLSVFIFISADSIAVRFDSGAGKTYVERDFTGSGVTNFDPTIGATIDTPLTEVPTTGAHGDLGILTHLTGSVDCGNQQSGSASLTLSGDTAAGALGGTVQEANVECVNSAAYGPYITIQALVSVAGKSTEAIIYFSGTRYSISIGGVGFFVSQNASEVSMSASGASASGDLTEEVSAGSGAHIVHMSGSVTCGTFISN